MPCDPLRNDDGKLVGFACGRRGGRPVPAPCAWCGKPSTALCDHPAGQGKTCDAPMCEEHRQRVGPNLDHCPDHRRQEELKL